MFQRSSDGSFWLYRRQAVRYRPDTDPPNTEIVLALEEVSQPGNTVLSWKGADPWRDTPDEKLQYAWRLDGGMWSPFASETSHPFTSLPAGAHIFEVRARDLEMQLLQSARLVSLGEMAAGVAHELNQPLTVISGAAEDVYLRLVEGLGISEGELRSKLQDVMALSERMADTVDHLRVFSRDTSGEPGVAFSVNEAVRSSLKLIQAQLANHGIALHLELGEGLPPVSGHPHQMEQVFLNLLANARDALDEGADGMRVKRLDVRTHCETGGGRTWVVAEVADTGAGMDEAHTGRVFEPFFTTKEAERGTGLGLSISYAIVQNHGGRIACESRKGEGTTFRVTLPATKEV